jgi:hypothetical protein
MVRTFMGMGALTPMQLEALRALPAGTDFTNAADTAMPGE